MTWLTRRSTNILQWAGFNDNIDQPGASCPVHTFCVVSEVVKQRASKQPTRGGLRPGIPINFGRPRTGQTRLDP